MTKRRKPGLYQAYCRALNAMTELHDVTSMALVRHDKILEEQEQYGCVDANHMLATKDLEKIYELIAKIYNDLL